MYANRVKETTTTTGTGTYSLAGAETGYQGFVAGIGTGNVCTYCVTDDTDWEVGVGTVTDAAPDTLARTSILSSSNADAAVDWGAGTKSAYVTFSAGMGTWDAVNDRWGFGTDSPAESIHTTGNIRADGGEIQSDSTIGIVYNASLPNQKVFYQTGGGVLKTRYYNSSNVIVGSFGFNSSNGTLAILPSMEQAQAFEFSATAGRSTLVVGSSRDFRIAPGGDLLLRGGTSVDALNIVSGDVGVNTAAPAAKLEVNTTTASVAGLIVQTTDDDGDTSYPLLVCQTSAAAAIGIEVLGDGKMGFFGATPITKPTEITDELTTITHTAPGTPDYALQDLIDSAGGSAFGFATKDEGNTLLSVVANLQARVNELESALSSLGLLADAD